MGDKLSNTFKKAIGKCDALPGEFNGVPFYVFSVMETDYAIHVMSTYGTTIKIKLEKTKRIDKYSNNNPRDFKNRQNK